MKVQKKPAELLYKIPDCHEWRVLTELEAWIQADASRYMV